MQKFKIEKGIPTPPIRANYPFKEMRIGDSFKILHTNQNIPQLSGNIHSAFGNIRDRGVLPKTYKITVKMYKKAGYHRVWRIK